MFANGMSCKESMMLVVSRKIGESICIGNNIELRVSEVRGGRVRLSISAPREVRVRRQELCSREPVACVAGAGESN